MTIFGLLVTGVCGFVLGFVAGTTATARYLGKLTARAFAESGGLVYAEALAEALRRLRGGSDEVEFDTEGKEDPTADSRG